MRLLLDRHTLLWYVLNDPRLSGTAHTLILGPNHAVCISPASYWEIAIKISIHEIALHQPYDDFMDLCLNRYGFSILPIEPKHTAQVTTLPFHHKDPFDRLLIAQALVEPMPLVSADIVFDAYGVQRFW